MNLPLNKTHIKTNKYANTKQQKQNPSRSIWTMRNGLALQRSHEPDEPEPLRTGTRTRQLEPQPDEVNEPGETEPHRNGTGREP